MENVSNAVIQMFMELVTIFSVPAQDLKVRQLYIKAVAQVPLLLALSHSKHLSSRVA